MPGSSACAQPPRKTVGGRAGQSDRAWCKPSLRRGRSSTRRGCTRRRSRRRSSLSTTHGMCRAGTGTGPSAQGVGDTRAARLRAVAARVGRPGHDASPERDRGACFPDRRVLRGRGFRTLTTRCCGPRAVPPGGRPDARSEAIHEVAVGRGSRCTPRARPRAGRRDSAPASRTRPSTTRYTEGATRCPGRSRRPRPTELPASSTRQ